MSAGIRKAFCMFGGDWSLKMSINRGEMRNNRRKGWENRRKGGLYKKAGF
jgi:hypothetical protein